MENSQKTYFVLWISALVVGLLSLQSRPARAESIVLPFVTHAAFFSSELHLTTPLDPQVFVAEPGSSGGIGPQAITHIAGVTNAHIADRGERPIMNALGMPLGMSLADWLGASGDVVLTPVAHNHERVTLVLHHLKPQGHYSAFANHFDQSPTGFTPLDGTGKTNSFMADSSGMAIVTIIAPAPLTRDNAVLVVYHSDQREHGVSRGEIGINAHHQLIARPQS